MPAQAADDRVLPGTRALSIVIIPFLVVAFVDLFFFPSAADTAKSFAWRIMPPFTPMLLASVYLGGAYFFLRAAMSHRWHEVEGGFLSVGLFATLMGITTIIHWKKFIHGNVAFWLWAGLYFTTPFLVFGVLLANRRWRRPEGEADLTISSAAGTLIGALGALAVGSTIFLFLFPRTAAHSWPWKLSDLTARVVGAIFGLGVAGIAAFWHRRWSAARTLLQVEFFMLTLILIAAIRAHRDFKPHRAFTWLFAVGFLSLAVASASLYARMEARRRVSTSGGGAPVPSTTD